VPSFFRSLLEYVHYSAGLGVMSLAEVRLQEGESLESALRRFKRKVMTEDIIKDVKRHSYYLKPGERRREKQALAQSVPEKRFVKSRIKLRQGGSLPPSNTPRSAFLERSVLSALRRCRTFIRLNRNLNYGTFLQTNFITVFVRQFVLDADFPE
jgi:small subunit ribosomal protein S21